MIDATEYYEKIIEINEIFLLNSDSSLFMRSLGCQYKDGHWFIPRNLTTKVTTLFQIDCSKQCIYFITINKVI